jgi:ABC-type lipoprotein release transport system permease subunit
VGVLALATIAHLLITSVRRRRRDLAVLRTIGFTRAQVRSTVAPGRRPPWSPWRW